METIHLTPSILNAWDELRHANDSSPVWVTPEEFKNSIVGDYKWKVSTEVGNAVHGFVFGSIQEYEVVDPAPNGKLYTFTVSDNFLKFRKMYPHGYGVSEVSKVKYLPETIDGCKVRISGRCDNLQPNLTVEMKTSSRPFGSKGTIRNFLESQQSFCYDWFWGNPVRFLFGEVEYDKKATEIFINLKRADYSTAYPSRESTERLFDCVRSLVPYLKSDADIWKRVTNRTLRDEF